MTDNPFDRLAPFIQEYIYGKGWADLRGVQVKAIQKVLDTPHHLLITSGTASGKTEAAFLPVLTALFNKPSASIGAIYIGPLKALINDQFERLQGLLEESHIPLQSWHGDIAQSKKENFLKQAQGVLQITPESLEAMLINRSNDLGRLFGDLRFVVIDEVHAFIDSDRGRQIICQLQRLSRYQKQPVRRIGLSATLGEPQLAAEWLAGGTSTPVEIVIDESGKRQLELGLEFFYKPAEEIEDEPETDTPEAQEHEALPHIFAMTQRQRKTLIFANSRGEVEEIGAGLRQFAEDQNRDPGMYHVHHGSIAAPLREAAEDAMRNSEQPACTVATVTLELGIDIGSLDQVLQYNTTHSVSSFVQRLGRTGRRAGSPSRMFFYAVEERPEDDASLGERIPWKLLQTIAIIQLYLEEKWIEPPVIPQLPFSLLYHQTMSIVVSAGEIEPPRLAERVLTLAPFSQISQQQYRDFLRHLVDTKHLERMETGSLIIGLAGEKVVNNYRFYATFETELEYQVRDASRQIGTVQAAPVEGDTIALAGFSWRVLEVNPDKRIIYVEKIKGKTKKLWLGGGGLLHRRILERIRLILQEDKDYGYLLPNAVQRLKEARELAQKTGLVSQTILPLGGNRLMLLPWVGTTTFNTFCLMLKEKWAISPASPFYLEIVAHEGELLDYIHTLAVEPPDVDELVAKRHPQELVLNKYDRFVPEDLLRQAFTQDKLDINGVVTLAQKITSHA